MRLGDLHHLFLIDHDAVGLGQDRRAVPDAAAPTPRRACAGNRRDVGHRAGAVQRHGGDQILEPVGAHLAQHVAHALAFELEHPAGIAARQHLVGSRIIERQPGEIDLDAMAAQDTRPRAAGRSASSGPRKSNFTRPACSTYFIEYCVTSISERGSRYSGTSSISGRSPITTPAAWVLAWRYRPSSCSAISSSRAHALVGRRASRCSRGSPSIACCSVTGLAGLLGISSATLLTCPNGSPSTRPTSRTAARACSLPNVMICATRSAPYSRAHVVDHLVAPVLAEIDVEIRHRHALGIEEALEQQIEAQRVEIGDGQRPGHDRAGARSRGRGRPGCRCAFAHWMKSATIRK